MKILLSFIVYTIFTISCSCGQIQNNSTENEAIKMLREFYLNYFTAFTELPIDSSQNKLETLQKKYCTVGFYEKIPNLIEQTGNDIFLKAQDSDIKYMNTLVISKGTKNNEYVVSYIAEDAPEKKNTIIIHLTLVKEGSNYKISSIR